MRSANATALETINAAATAIASAENRAPQASDEKRRWGGCWSVYWCFGTQKQKKRIGHSRLVPDTTTASRSEGPPPENPTQPPSVALPFAAPPSSPASFLQSEPPSCTQSPGGLLSFTSISDNMYSPGPASMFAIGPYAHETQLVSPPVFSTFNTEPSTAPFTPPPESVQFTTPSSPEVPFARLLDPYHQNNEAGQRLPMSQYEFQSYHLYPGSPVGQLISPSSGISNSGTSSPFPDREFTSGGQFSHHPKLLNLERRSLQGSGSLTPDTTAPRSRDSVLLDRQNSDISPLPVSFNGLRNDDVVVDHRVSFEVTAEDVVRCMAKEPYRAKAVSSSSSLGNAADKGEVPTTREGHSDESHDSASEKASAEDEDGQRPHRNRSITLGSVKEFNFDSADGGNFNNPTTVGSEWWTDEKVPGKASGAPSKDWSFFPMMQPGVS